MPITTTKSNDSLNDNVSIRDTAIDSSPIDSSPIDSSPRDCSQETYQKLMKQGLELMNQFQSRQAEQVFLKITREFPHQTQGWMGLALVSYDRLKVQAAIDAFNSIGHATGDWYLAESSACHMHLVSGDYEKGWEGYMKRKRSTIAKEIPYLQQDSDFKHLIIIHEQGYGDMIQFARFFVHLRKQFPNKEITFLCPAPLLRLMEPFCNELNIALHNNEDGDISLADHQVKNGHYQHIHICSLAAFFKCGMRNVGLPMQVNLGYDKAKADKLRAKKTKKNRQPLIGLCWSGKPEYSKDYKRSCPPHKVIELVNNLKGCKFISLTQPSPMSAEQNKIITNHPRINCQRIEQIKDFYDTASLIMACDAVITVDTACVHLACTLRKPTYLMLPYAPDWRWKLGRIDSPWYPHCRIFRQRRLGNWDNIIPEVCTALSKQFSPSSKKIKQA